MAGVPQLSTNHIEGLTRQFEVIAHNLANVSTNGFKRQRVGFASVLADKAGPAAKGRVEGKVSTDFTQGALVRTNRPLDVALEGEGFFVVETPQGIRLTRNGTFRVNSNGQIVDTRNRPVAGEGGPITLPPFANPETVQIASDGTVSAGGEAIGRLRIMGYKDLSLLTRFGDGDFVADPAAEPVPAPPVRVHQGHREASNVNLIEEMVGMIATTRMYEAGLKAISTRGESQQSILRVAMS
ncbi:MAG TPA: flagellar hook basal-body protein [Phycisphaerae bacterium]|nr:flagellar hook basal-body protein [Phycisphaerae bacterium]